MLVNCLEQCPEFKKFQQLLLLQSDAKQNSIFFSSNFLIIISGKSRAVRMRKEELLLTQWKWFHQDPQVSFFTRTQDLHFLGARGRFGKKKKLRKKSGLALRASLLEELLGRIQHLYFSILWCVQHKIQVSIIMYDPGLVIVSESLRLENHSLGLPLSQSVFHK